MKGLIYFQNPNNSMSECGHIGEYAWTYNSVDYHVGDILFIKDTFNIEHTSIITKQCNNYYIYGYPISENGYITDYDFKEIKIIKSYQSLKNGEHFVVDNITFVIKIQSYDSKDYSMLSDKEIENILTIEDKLSLVILQIDLFLEKYETLTEKDFSELKILSNKYALYDEILKNKKDTYTRLKYISL